MADIIVTLPVQMGEESQLFGQYFNRFTESRSFEAERMSEMSDAPYLMMRSDPGDGEEIKILTFQEDSVASAFSSGWTQARSRKRPARRA